MKKEKIGKGYYRVGHLRGYDKTPTVWKINGKAYIKTVDSSPFETDLKGYTMVNKRASTGTFYGVGLISEHEKLPS